MKLIDRVQMRWMVRLLKKHKGQKTAAAKELGISIRTWRQWEIAFGMRLPLPQRRSRTNE